ncbi:MAG: LexA family protein [bacterium]
MNATVTEVYTSDESTELELPLAEAACPAGFPSPADDHMEKRLDLNEHLIEHPAATFFVRVSGNSMIDAGIHDDDILVVDRSLEPRDGKVVIAVLNGELSVKRLKKREDALYLQAENDDYQSIEVSKESDLRIWGVATHVIHDL